MPSNASTGVAAALSCERVPAANPKAAFLAHQKDIDEAIQRVLAGGWYILGEEVRQFENEFARYLDVQHAIGVASGTDALVIALRACGVGPGDIVVTVSHTAVATVCSICGVGAIPLLVDIDPRTYTMDFSLLANAFRNDYSHRIKAIIPVHLYGYPVEMAPIVELARKNHAYVIEDCAQAHGATRSGHKTGSFGDIGAFSFYPTKNLGALGDGGAVVTSDDKLAVNCRLLRQYGWQRRYVSDIHGMNSRLDELQAAILRVKLRFLDEDNHRRRSIASHYADQLAATDITLPQECPGSIHAYHQYVIRCSRRDNLQAFLTDHAVETAILYPVPVHLQDGYRKTVTYAAEGLPVTEAVCREILSLPLYPELTDAQVGRVADL